MSEIENRPVESENERRRRLLGPSMDERSDEDLEAEREKAREEIREDEERERHERLKAEEVRKTIKARLFAELRPLSTVDFELDLPRLRQKYGVGPDALRTVYLETRKADTSAKQQARKVMSANRTTATGELPKINAGIKDLATITRQAWEALNKSNLPPRLFVYGGIPSRIENRETKRGDKEPVTIELSLDRLRYELARAASWERKTDSGTVDAMPPVAVVRDVLATPNPDLPVLERIVRAPIFSRSGNLHTIPGYSADSRTSSSVVPEYCLTAAGPNSFKGMRLLMLR